MNLMRIYCACGLAIASFFLLTCYDSPSPLAPPDMDINVVLMSSFGRSTIPSATATTDSIKTFEVGRQVQLKIIMTGSSYVDSISIVITSDIDSIGETMPYRYFWTDTVWSPPYDLNDTVTRTVSVTAFAKGMVPIERQCKVKVRVLFLNAAIDSVFNQNSPCSIVLKAMGPADDSLNFSIPDLYIWRKTFDVASLNLSQNSKDSALLYFAPIGHPGVYSIPVVVTDSRKTSVDTLYFKAEVQYVDLSPTIDTVIGRTTVTAGEPISLEVLFSNHDGDPNLSMIVKNKLDGAVFSTATDDDGNKKAIFLWNTDSGDTGIDTVTLIAKDNGMLTDTETIFLQVTPVIIEVLPPPPPVPLVVFAGKGGSITLVSLPASGAPNGIITSADTVDIGYSDSAIFTITPDTGFHLADVIVDGLSKGQVARYRFTDVRTPHEIRAEFALDQYTFSLLSDGHGTVTPAIMAKIDHGIMFGIAAKADDGYHFVKWVALGKVTIADSSAIRTTVTVMGDSAKVAATFEADPVRILDSVTITADPLAATVFEGDMYIFSVTTSGPNVNYQWFRDNSPITGAVSATYTKAAVLADSGKAYCCIVSNTRNSDTSATAVLFVKSHSVRPNTITTASAQICEGDSTTLTVSGGTLLNGATWKWYSAMCGGSYAGEGTSIIVKPIATTTYFVRAEGAGDTSGCAAIAIQVNTKSIAPNGISANPAAICSGTSSTLSIAGGVLGTGAQWKWYAGSCGNNFQLAGTGNQITVWPQQTTKYYVRSEGQCSTSPCSTITVIVYKPFFDSLKTKIKRTRDIVTYGDNINLSIDSAPRVGDWVWLSNTCDGTPLDTGNLFSPVPLTMGNVRYYVRDQNYGNCDTVFFDNIVVDTTNPLAFYPLKTLGTITPNASPLLDSKYNMNCSSVEAIANGTDKWIKMSGSSYLQASNFLFFSKDEFTISAWVNIDSANNQKRENTVFWINSSGIKVKDSIITYYYNGETLPLPAFKFNPYKKWIFFIYKVKRDSSDIYVSGQIDTLPAPATPPATPSTDTAQIISICTKTFAVNKALSHTNPNLFFGGQDMNASLTTGGLSGELDNIRIYAYPLDKMKVLSDFNKNRKDP